MLSGTGIGDHSVKSTLNRKDGVKSRGDRFFVGNISLNEFELALELLLEASKIITGLGDVEGVDYGG